VTTIILINAALGAVVLAAILALVGWAIKTQRRDHLAGTATAPRREQLSREGQATRRGALTPRLG
jgi:hypothetical protein